MLLVARLFRKCLPTNVALFHRTVFGMRFTFVSLQLSHAPEFFHTNATTKFDKWVFEGAHRLVIIALVLFTKSLLTVTAFEAIMDFPMDTHVLTKMLDGRINAQWIAFWASKFIILVSFFCVFIEFRFCMVNLIVCTDSKSKI